MAASNDNLGKVYQSEPEVADENLAIPNAGEQLQELLTILTELQLVKNFKQRPNELKLPLSSQQQIERFDEQENQRKRLSFLIESSAVVPEVLTNNEEIPSQRRQINNEELGVSSTAAKTAKNYRPSEEELAQAVEEFKRLQQLLFERDVPEFYSHILNAEQRLENFESLMSEPQELMNLVRPLIPELVREEVEGFKLELKKAIELATNDGINPLEFQAKLHKFLAPQDLSQLLPLKLNTAPQQTLHLGVNLVLA